jgi:effector-binding domain-containing protein
MCLVAYEVRTERAEPRPLAAVQSRVSQQGLAAEIIRLLDIVWPVLRGQGVPTRHNVVIYHGQAGGELAITAGVEVLAAFSADGDVQAAATPAGEVATTAHFGDYARLGGAYEALGQWCTASGRRPAGVNWEVYGDWDEDPAKVRTDVYFLLEPA